MSVDGDTKTLIQVIQDAITKRLHDVHVSLPAMIVTYEPNTQMASVQPLLHRRYKVKAGLGLPSIPGTGAYNDVLLPIITNVPVQWPSGMGGTGYLHIPLVPGDYGKIVFCERSIDKWKSGTGLPVTPEDTRTHNLSDAVFEPGMRPFKNALKNVSALNVALCGPLSSIEFTPTGGVKIKAKADEAFTILVDLLTVLVSAKIFDPVSGLLTFDPATVLLLEAIKARLQLFKV